jgi:transketolase C-terminal domain/subunit
MSFIAIKNTYARSGEPEELLKRYGLTAEDIVGAVLSTLTRKHL